MKATAQKKISGGKSAKKTPQKRKQIQKTSKMQTIAAVLERNSWIVPSFLSVVLFIAAIWGIDKFNQFLLFDDEFGYWTASAYLTGTDWTSVASGIPYYSYGYGFLILTPIRLIFSDAELMYRAAIVVNALLLVGSYWIARAVVGQIFEKLHRIVVDVICFTVMLYPANLLFAHIAWAECTLVFIFWVFVWVSLRVIRRPSVWNHIGLAVVTLGLYVIHQRTIAVPIATLIIMFWCFIIDKDRRKYIIAFAVTFALFMLLHSFIKNDLINTYYNDNTKMAVNNMAGQTDKIKTVFTGSGFVSFLGNIIGKWFYLFVATLMMAWWGAGALLKSAVNYIKNVFSDVRTHHKREGLSQDISLWYIWLLLAFAGNFIVAAIFMSVGSRNDCLFYGRYTEHMIGIYFIVGVITFLQDKKWVSKMMVYFIITFICGCLCQSILDADNITDYQAYHSICTSLFLKKGESAEGAAMEYAMWGFAFSLFVMIMLKMKRWSKLVWIQYGVVVFSILILSCNISYRQVFGTMSEKQWLRIGNITSIIEWIEHVDAESSHRVYYCSDTESRYWSESFQFLLQERPLTVINSADINSAEDAFYVVGDDFVTSEGFDERYFCIKKSNQFALIVDKNQYLSERAREMMGEQR